MQERARNVCIILHVLAALTEKQLFGVTVALFFQMIKAHLLASKLPHHLAVFHGSPMDRTRYDFQLLGWPDTVSCDVAHAQSFIRLEIRQNDLISRRLRNLIFELSSAVHERILHWDLEDLASISLQVISSNHTSSISATPCCKHTL